MCCTARSLSAHCALPLHKNRRPYEDDCSRGPDRHRDVRHPRHRGQGPGTDAGGGRARRPGAGVSGGVHRRLPQGGRLSHLHRCAHARGAPGLQKILRRRRHARWPGNRPARPGRWPAPAVCVRGHHRARWRHAVLHRRVPGARGHRAGPPPQAHAHGAGAPGVGGRAMAPRCKRWTRPTASSAP